jgi:hypothetical protein
MLCPWRLTGAGGGGRGGAQCQNIKGGRNMIARIFRMTILVIALFCPQLIIRNECFAADKNSGKTATKQPDPKMIEYISKAGFSIKHYKNWFIEDKIGENRDFSTAEQFRNNYFTLANFDFNHGLDDKHPHPEALLKIEAHIFQNIDNTTSDVAQQFKKLKEITKSRNNSFEKIRIDGKTGYKVPRTLSEYADFSAGAPPPIIYFIDEKKGAIFACYYFSKESSEIDNIIRTFKFTK